MNLAILYALVGFALAYFYKHQLNIVNLIPVKADIKMRNKIIKKQKQIKLYIKMCPVWPILLLKEIYDEVQERRQG